MLLKIVTSNPTAIISAVSPKKDLKKDAPGEKEWLLLSFIFRIVIYYSIYTKKPYFRFSMLSYLFTV